MTALTPDRPAAHAEDCDVGFQMAPRCTCALAERRRIFDLERRVEELEARPQSLLRGAVVAPRLDLSKPEDREKLARGAAVHRSLREPCTVHGPDEYGDCYKCGRRVR